MLLGIQKGQINMYSVCDIIASSESILRRVNQIDISIKNIKDRLEQLIAKYDGNIHKLEIIKFIGLMQNINVNNKRKYKKTNKVKHQRFKVTTKGLLCRRSRVRYLLLTNFSFP